MDAGRAMNSSKRRYEMHLKTFRYVQKEWTIGNNIKPSNKHFPALASEWTVPGEAEARSHQQMPHQHQAVLYL
jgi:hypothetical protein